MQTLRIWIEQFAFCPLLVNAESPFCQINYFSIIRIKKLIYHIIIINYFNLLRYKFFYFLGPSYLEKFNFHRGKDKYDYLFLNVVKKLLVN